MFLAPLAEFFQIQAGRGDLTILVGMVVDVMTNRAFHRDQIILGHDCITG